jgi:DNA-3-methyladenine glycosylase I
MQKRDKKITRCSWCGDDELYIKYHDTEWGVPLHGDQKLFELLTLEGAQAGLSWLTVLRRREGYRKAFENFDIEKVANYSEPKVKKLLGDKSIIRNKLKVSSTIKNAQVILDLRNEFGSFDKYIWSFINNKSTKPAYASVSSLPSSSDEAVLMSKDLRRRGFNFVGPTICYAFMQSSGMVNDHIKSCFRYSQISIKNS